jgi:rod shape determining protein RodA
MLTNYLKYKLITPLQQNNHKSFWQLIHLDGLLLLLLMLLIAVGFIILYSASNQQLKMMEYQFAHFIIGMIALFILAQISPITLKRYAPWIYLLGLICLFVVLVIGHIGKGGQRWLHLGFIRFQPAEIMKLAIPLTLAWYLDRFVLPLSLKNAFIPLALILVPTIITAKQPDLGTAILLFMGGAAVLFLAGISWRILVTSFALFLASLPFIWYLLYDYQKHRVLTFLDPEKDPLGKGYHIIQSKIAIGSGGLFGKGWLHGTQSNLHFLPEHTTDFIFAVASEEFGFIGGLILLMLYMLIVCRGLYITIHAQDTFCRLLAGSITFVFFVSFFINIGMVSGILPVVGIPLPLISYGGTAMVTMLANFGILMSIHTHRKLVAT